MIEQGAIQLRREREVTAWVEHGDCDLDDVDVFKVDIEGGRAYVLKCRIPGPRISGSYVVNIVCTWHGDSYGGTCEHKEAVRRFEAKERELVPS